MRKYKKNSNKCSRNYFWIKIYIIYIYTEQSATAQSLLQGAIAQMAFNQSAIGGRSAAVVMQYLQEADASILYYKNNNLGSTLFDNMWHRATTMVVSRRP